MADSRVGAARVKDECEIFYYARLKGNTQRIMGTCPRDTEVDLKRVLTGQNGDSLNNKIMFVTVMNPCVLSNIN